MRNCKVIFYKTEKRGQSGADGGDGGRGRFAQNYFAILQSPFAETQRGARPLRRSAGGGPEALTGAANRGEEPAKRKPAEAQ